MRSCKSRDGRCHKTGAVASIGKWLPHEEGKDWTVLSLTLHPMSRSITHLPRGVRFVI